MFNIVGLHNLPKSKIFKTYENDLDGISNKLGFSKRSFAEWGTQVKASFEEAGKGVNGFKEAIATAFSAKNKGNTQNLLVNSLGETVTENNIDTYIEKLNESNASDLLKFLQTEQFYVNENQKSWDDYYQTLDENEQWRIKFIQNTDLQTASTEDLIKANQAARESAIAHNKALQQQTLSAKAGSVALKALSVAGNMLVMWGISELISVPFKIAQAFDDMTERAREAADTFNEQSNDLDSYKEKITELQTALASENISTDDAVAKRQELYSLQDEMIEKYGQEAGAINLVTEAVNGNVAALNELNRSQWNNFKNTAQSTEGFWEGFVKFISGTDPLETSVGYMSDPNYTDMWGMSAAPIVTLDRTMDNIPSDMEAQFEEILQRMADRYSIALGAGTTSAGISLITSGTSTEALSQLKGFKEDFEQEIRDTFGEDYASDINRYTSSIADEITKLEENIAKHQSTYETYMQGYLMYESKYAEQYAQILKDRANLEKVRVDGDETTIENAQRTLVENIEALADKASGDGQQNIADFVLTLYPDITLDLHKNDFISAYEEDVNGIVSELKAATGALEGLSIEDILALDENSANATKEQKEGLDTLTKACADYGLELSDLLDILSEFGLVQSRIDFGLNEAILAGTGKSTESLPASVQQQIGELSDEVKLKLIEELNKADNQFSADGLTQLINSLLATAAENTDTTPFLSYTNSLGEAISYTKDQFAELFNIENTEDNPFDGSINGAKDYITVLGSLENRVRSVTSAIDEQTETGYISASTAGNLIEQNEAYGDALIYSEDGIRLNIEALKDKMKAENDVAIAEANHTLQTISKTKATAHDTAEAIRNAAANRGVEIPTAGLKTIREAQATWQEQDALEKQVRNYLTTLQGRNNEIDALGTDTGSKDKDTLTPHTSNTNIYDYLTGQINDEQSYIDDYNKEVEDLQEQYSEALAAQDFETAETIKQAIAEKGANFRKVLGSDTARLRGEATAEISSLLAQSAPNLADIPFDEITSDMWLDAERALDDQYTAIANQIIDRQNADKDADVTDLEKLQDDIDQKKEYLSKAQSYLDSFKDTVGLQSGEGSFGDVWAESLATDSDLDSQYMDAFKENTENTIAKLQESVGNYDEIDSLYTAIQNKAHELAEIDRARNGGNETEFTRQMQEIWQEAQSQRLENRNTEFDDIMDSYSQVNDELEHNLAMLDENSATYFSDQAKIVVAQAENEKKSLESVRQEIIWLDEYYQNDSLNRDYLERRKELVDTYNSGTEALKGYADTLEEISDAEIDVLVDTENTVKDYLESYLSDIEDAYQEEIDLAEEAADKRKAAIDEEIQAIEDKKAALQDQWDLEDTLSDRADKLKERGELASQYNELSLAAGSGDLEALSQANDLQDQINDIDKELAEDARDYWRDAALESLDNQVELLEEQSSKIDEQTQVMSDNLTELQSIHEDMLSGENQYNLIHALMNGETVKINGEDVSLDSIVNSVKSEDGSLYSYGASRDLQDLQDQLNQASSIYSEAVETPLMKAVRENWTKDLSAMTGYYDMVSESLKNNVISGYNDIIENLAAKQVPQSVEISIPVNIYGNLDNVTQAQLRTELQNVANTLPNKIYSEIASGISKKGNLRRY